MKRHLLILLLTALLGVVAVALCKYWNVLFPTGETSEIYRHYHKTPGIHVAYIQDMTVDDTIHFDMTLLEARDSATFVWLLRDLGDTPEQIQVQMEHAKKHDNPHFVSLFGDEYLSCTLPAQYKMAIIHPRQPKDKIELLTRAAYKELNLTNK